MKKEMDKIIFENRMEIISVMKALDTFQKEHPKREECEDVKTLQKLLDVMEMEW